MNSEEKICGLKDFVYLCNPNGVLAQLVERLNGIQKVRSSILLCSTSRRTNLFKHFFHYETEA